jgi:hypothetical protein
MRTAQFAHAANWSRLNAPLREVTADERRVASGR